MDIEKDLLPIGSVVQVGESTALVMIAGYLPFSPSDPNRLWNYSGFRFPLGYTDDEDVYFFDHDQIQNVYAYGYRDIEHDLFMTRLSDSLRNYAEKHADGESAENREHEEEGDA